MDKHSQINGSNIFLIHGHHMKSGWMFKDLMKYKSESFYKEHATFEFSTLYGKDEYEIVAVILSKCIVNQMTCLNTIKLGMYRRPPSSIHMFRISRNSLFMTQV